MVYLPGTFKTTDGTKGIREQQTNKQMSSM